ncbi:MAG: hypothetical protein JO115_04200 [Pseudonocardiales bacterium]|nr:hypothetical protein [Pseudonocardiales bacterium]
MTEKSGDSGAAQPLGRAGFVRRRIRDDREVVGNEGGDPLVVGGEQARHRGRDTVVRLRGQQLDDALAFLRYFQGRVADDALNGQHVVM